MTSFVKLHVKLVVVIVVSVQVSTQRTDVIYGTPGLLNDDSLDVDIFNSRGLTGSSNLQLEPFTTGGSTGRGNGRVVGNSILEPQSQGVSTGGMRPMIRYRPQPQQNQRSNSIRRQQSPNSNNRLITTGPSVGTIRNGIEEETEDIEDEIEQPLTMTTTTSRGRNAEGENVEVSKFVSVFVSPPEPIQSRRPKPIKAASQKLHYNILFIKAPNMMPESQEIQLPPHPQTKTMVYVLLRRPEMKDMLKITQPPTPAPQKPEVFFIRYKNDKKQQEGVGMSADKNNESKMEMQLEDQDNDKNDPGSVTMSQQQRRGGGAIKLKQFQGNTNARGGSGSVSSFRGSSSLGGYENSEASDNDFSSRETYDENEVLLTSRQQQYHHNQIQNQQQRFVQSGSGSGYSFAPVNSRYGITS